MLHSGMTTSRPTRIGLPRSQRNQSPALIALLLAISVMTPSPCSATFSGLIQIPTTDHLAPNEYNLTLQFVGPLPSPSPDFTLVETQFGVGRRAEVGIDFVTGDQPPSWPLLNAKYVVLAGRKRQPSMALGIGAIGTSLTTLPYAVVSQDFGDFGGHIGLFSSKSGGRWFGGLDRAVSGTTTIEADYVSGAGNFAALGAVYSLNPSLSVQGGVLFPNSGGKVAFTVEVGFGGYFKPPPR